MNGSPAVLGLVAVFATSVGALGSFVLAGQRARRDSVPGPGLAAELDGYGPVDPELRPPVRAGATTGLRRAIDRAGDVAGRHGLLDQIDQLLKTADVPIRAPEIVLTHLAVIGVGIAAAWLLTGNPLMTVMVALVTLGAGPAVLRMVAGRRQQRLLAQLPDTLLALAGALRSGRSVGQAIEAVATDAAEPMGRELRKVVAEVRLGQPLADAMASAAARVGSEDFDWVVLAMRVQQEVGGNLAELLDRAAQTVRSRALLRGEVKALTAEGRASALMLVLMPPILGLVMYAVNRDYMSSMFEYGAGQVMIGLCVVMISGGYLWMRKTVSIHV